MAEQREHRRVRADEGDAGPLARLGEGRILAEEAVAGVYGVAVVGERGLHEPVGVEVRRGPGAHEGVAFAGEADREGLGVVLGVGHDGRGARGADAPQEAHGDLAAVGDQHPVDAAGCGFQAHVRSIPARRRSGYSNER